jgi:hypothetical protein
MKLQLFQVFFKSITIIIYHNPHYEPTKTTTKKTLCKKKSHRLNNLASKPQATKNKQKNPCKGEQEKTI